LIVGLVEPTDGSQPQKAVSLQAIDHAGARWPAVRGGCPKAPNFVCSYSWSTNPSDERMRIDAELESSGTVSTEVELAPHNYCARRIAYVELYLGEPVHFTQVRYVSPCNDVLSD
jgi:hypothetical protein